MTLDMTRFLETVNVYGVEAREHLIVAGFHPKVIYAKAEKAAAKGYTDYGVVADRPWLTSKGRTVLGITEDE